MISSVCSPSIDSSFFVSLKSNQSIACPFQIKRNYLSGPWKLPDVLSIAKKVLWAIFLHWEHVAGFIFLWCFCAFSRPSRLLTQEYEIRNCILISCVGTIIWKVQWDQAAGVCIENSVGKTWCGIWQRLKFHNHGLVRVPYTHWHPFREVLRCLK